MKQAQKKHTAKKQVVIVQQEQIEEGDSQMEEEVEAVESGPMPISTLE